MSLVSSCQRKVPYQNRKQARHALTDIIGHTPNWAKKDLEHRLIIYICENCGLYHIGKADGASRNRSNVVYKNG